MTGRLVVLERNGKIVTAAPAELITPDREVAWAEGLIRHNPLYAWVLGRFVGAGEANANGHIFDAEELKEGASSLVHAPLNMLHRPHQVLGTYVGGEVVYPAQAQDLSAQPFMESLAAMWRYYFPEEYAVLKMAHASGVLAQSMECIPRSVTCAAAAGCGQTFKYAGRASDTYCDHINGPPAGARKLNKPHFSAGAIVIPPAVPAWKGAQVTRLSASLRQAEAEGLAATLYDQVAAAVPGLSEGQREQFMASVMALTGPGAPKPPKRASAAAKPDQPHAHVDTDPEEQDSPCRICGRDADSPIHQGIGLPRLTAAEDATMAMVAFYPAADVAATMALGGEFSQRLSPADLHITLAFLGPNAVNEMEREAVEAVLAPLAASFPPLEGWVSGIGRFSAGYPAGQDEWPLYASIDMPAMPEFRQRLVAALSAAGIPHARNHGFTPHMTLAYVGAEDEPAAAQLLASGIAPVALRIGSVVLAWGKDRTAFPLGTAGANNGDPVAAIVARAQAEAATVPVWDPLLGRAISAEARSAGSRRGWALPDGSFYIETAADLRNAIKLRDNGSHPAAAKRHIVRRARALRATTLLPEGWA